MENSAATYGRPRQALDGGRCSADWSCRLCRLPLDCVCLAWLGELVVLRVRGPRAGPDVPPKLVLDLAPTRPLLPQTGPAIQLRCGKPSTLILTRCMGGGGFAL